MLLCYTIVHCATIQNNTKQVKHAAAIHIDVFILLVGLLSSPVWIKPQEVLTVSHKYSKKKSNIPLEHTPDPQPLVYVGDPLSYVYFIYFGVPGVWSLLEFS